MHTCPNVKLFHEKFISTVAKNYLLKKAGGTLVDPGTSWVKMTHKNIKKIINFIFEVLDVLF
jgi:hypothetical protein